MFLTLLIVTFVVATLVATIVARAFTKPVDQILKRIIADEISSAWRRYLMFALYVVGISSGVRIWDLEKYITKPPIKDAQVIQLTSERWVLEVYRTIIETLQGLAWVLLVFFVCALLAFVVVRLFETRRTKSDLSTSRPESPANAPH
jgi:large-conductance mechanosensitive channel